MRNRILTLALLALPAVVTAQTNEQFADMNDTIEMVRDVTALERKAVITRNLGLSSEESTAFWPIYDDYAAEKKRVNDRQVKVITDYAANFENLSDELAMTLVNDSMKVQDDLLKVRKKYVKKLKKVLSPKTLARFYQLENKLDAVANVTMAQGIPLVTD
jgi:hypothetical protein